MSGLTTRVNIKTTFDSKESLFLMGVGALTGIWGGHSPPVYLPFVAVYWSLKLDKTFLRDGATHLHLRGALTSICGAWKGISAFNITHVMKYETIFAFPIIINNEMVQEVAIRNPSLKKTYSCDIVSTMGDRRSQGINTLGIDLVLCEYSTLSSRRVYLLYTYCPCGTV